MKVLSVINYKGGVGKTTVTANLAAYAAQQGRRVLMLDLDPQASLTFSFMSVRGWITNYSKDKTIYQFFGPYAKRADNTIPLESLIISLAPLGVKLDMICSHLVMVDTEAELSSLLAGDSLTHCKKNFVTTHTLLRAGLDSVKAKYDLVLIDCPPSFQALVKNALTASDAYLIPAKMDYLSTIGINQLKVNTTHYLEEYDQNARAADQPTRDEPLKLLGIAPTMLTLYRGAPIIAAQPYLEELERMYRIFPWLQERATFYAPAPQRQIPAILNNYYRPGFREAKRELENLCKEVLSAV